MVDLQTLNHEFGHVITYSKKMDDAPEFWREFKALRRQYVKELEDLQNSIQMQRNN